MNVQMKKKIGKEYVLLLLYKSQRIESGFAKMRKCNQAGITG